MSGELYKPTYLAELCEQYHLSPSKQFGQNYLVVPAIIEKIISSVDLSNKDTVVEVGSGFGVLTFALAQYANKVISFEIEQTLRPYWEKYAPKNLEMVWGNVLTQFNSSKLGEYHVVANLPYQITSDALRLFLDAEHKPATMTVMVQKEVADRLTAKPGQMSMLSVAAQYYAVVKRLFVVKPGNFWPAPKVDSAVVRFEIKQKQWDNKVDQQILGLARAGFARKRKTLVKNLSAVSYKKEKVLSVLEILGQTPTVRAQELSVENWIALHEVLSSRA